MSVTGYGGGGDAEVSDIDLIESIQNNTDTDASLKELIARHSGIYFSIVNKYFPESRAASSRFNIDRELVFNSKDLVIYNSALSYDKDRGAKFSTHIGNQVRYFCLGQINKSKTLVPFEPKEFENIFSEESEIHEKIDKNISTRIVDIIKQIPDERVYEIFKLRYLDSKGKRATPWSKIYKRIPHAKSKGRHLTIQGCINLHNKALKEIRRKVRDLKDNV